MNKILLGGIEVMAKGTQGFQKGHSVPEEIKDRNVQILVKAKRIISLQKNIRKICP